jgi:hypothetical protein
MPATRTYLVGLVIFALSHGVAAGSPIQVYLHGYVDGHLVDQTVPLGDPSQPLSIPIASTHLTASSGPNGYYGSGTIDSIFNLYVSVSSPDSPTPAGSAGVWVGGAIHGS